MKTDIFIEKAKKIHNNRYDYSSVEYINSKTKINITCRVHGKFLQWPTDHLSGKNCRACSIVTRSRKRKLSTQDIVSRGKKIHRNKYNYSLTTYSGEYNKIIIICPTHGQFKQTPYQHIYMKCGCYKCFSETLTKPIEQFIIDANNVHNHKYDYSLIKTTYKNAKSKIAIICTRHGAYTQTVHNHLKGRGCPRCRAKTQTYIYNTCKEVFPNYEIFYNYRGFDWLKISKYGTLELDIYIKELKLAIEYDGEQHFKPVCFGNMSYDKAKKNYELITERDSLKEALITKNKLDVNHLIRFNYTELPLSKKYIKYKLNRISMET